jgi:RNA polymerase sigma factor (sigma-70 family)
MATSLLNPVIHQLRRAVLLPDGAGLTDGQLLESFVSQRDEAAFGVLVRRHGPMVLGVCRRVLRNHHDAEDAFQATFLVLVRKAASIVPREMVANWLYGVAYRTALKARGLIAKRSAREKQVTEMPEPEAVEPDDCWRELQPLLDQELSRLPDKYRVPVVLCDLGGKTAKEVARQLAWPEGTVSSRLARGRRMLARRLTRHGLALSGGSLAAVLAENASACVPASVVSATIQAANLFAAGKAAAAGVISAKVATQAEGVLQAMFLNKLKITLALFAVVAVVGAGLSGVSFRAAAKDQPAAQTGRHQFAPADQKTPGGQDRDQDAAKSDLEKMQGTWLVVSSQVGDEKAAADEVARRKVTVKGNVLTYDYGNEQKEKQEGTVKLNPETKAFDWSWTVEGKPVGTTMLAIYELKGDDLRIGFGNDGLVRPRRIVIGKEDVAWLLVLRRDKARHNGKEAPGEQKPADQDQAKQILDMVFKGFQAYRGAKGGRGRPEDLAKKDMEKLQGAWRVISSQVGDEKAPEDEVARRKVTVKGDKLTYDYGNERKERQEGTIKLDPKTRAFDWTWTFPQEGATMLGIYELKGDDLRICFGELVRPRRFEIGKDDVVWLLALRREQPKQDVPKKEANPNGEEKRTIAAIKELGGHVLVDRKTEGSPVVRVVLSETAVKDKDLEQLKGLPSLKELYLFRTRITGEGLKHLKDLARMQRLDLSHCTGLTEAGRANLKGLTKLQTLDLTATGMGDADLKHIKNLTDLQVLYLRFNPKVTDVGLRELKGLTKLETLVLDRTEISDAGLKHLTGLTKLRTLHLANAQLTDATLEQLKGFSDLRSLSLMGTKATDAGLVHLKGLTNLEELYLDGTQVTDAGLGNLAGLTKLRTLSLRLTKTTGEGVAGLKQALLKVKVIR